MHPSKMKNLSTMSPKERANYSIRRIADFEVLWALAQDNGDLVIDDIDSKLSILYIWPEAELAKNFMPGHHKDNNAKPFEISVYSMIDICIPDMNKLGVKFSVFFGPDDKSWIYTPDELKDALEQDLQEHL